jgi:hypothetical protein
MSRVLRATTPFPNHLLDEAMPHLKDTEWRVLCVIVRQTLGWHDKASKNRKTSDWLAQSQLVKKTGRDRAALSHALDALVRACYIEVRSEKGGLLQTPKERRQCRGRLFFALHPRLFAPLLEDDQESKSQDRAPVSNSLLEQGVSKSEYQRASKANTTKEKQTKEIATKAVPQSSLRRLAAEVWQGALKETDKASTQKKLLDVEPGYSIKAQDFMALFEQLYAQMKKQTAGVRLLQNDAERLEKLLASHPSLDWEPILRAFFASNANYIARRNHALPAFLDSCNIFLMQYLPPPPFRADRSKKDRSKNYPGCAPNSKKA